MRVQNEKGQFVRQSVEDRFWNFVDKSGGEDACWLWTGEVNSGGYGRITDYWQKILAHRYSWSLVNGEIPEGKSICHTCDVRACVNPRHLWLGSHRDNMQDALAKGRHGGLVTGKPGKKGEENVRAILTDEQVRAIRAAYIHRPPDHVGRWSRKGRPTVTSLAEEYGVSRSLIGAILKRKVWTHLE